MAIPVSWGGTGFYFVVRGQGANEEFEKREKLLDFSFFKIVINI